VEYQRRVLFLVVGTRGRKPWLHTNDGRCDGNTAESCITNKGKGKKKKAFYVLRDYYQKLEKQ
jgi:hypothetical protein